MTVRVRCMALCLAGAIMVPLSRAVNQGGLTSQLWRRLGIWSRAPLNKPAAAPDRHMPVSPFNTDNGQTTMKQGNTTLQFGQQRSFTDRYNTDNIFNPYNREGR